MTSMTGCVRFSLDTSPVCLLQRRISVGKEKGTRPLKIRRKHLLLLTDPEPGLHKVLERGGVLPIDGLAHRMLARERVVRQARHQRVLCCVARAWYLCEN